MIKLIIEEDFELSTIHKPLLGKLAKLTKTGVYLEEEYQKLFGIGNYWQTMTLFYYCHSNDRYEISFVFIDEKPIRRGGVIWYCLKEIGEYSEGNYYWFTLNQLIICSEI